MTRASTTGRLFADALGIYAASRFVGLAILLLVEDQLHGRRFAGGPPFRLWTEVFARWDAVFYRTIAIEGYPATLPTDASGAVAANTWAFFPVFPVTAGAISRVTGLAFEPAAVLLNVLAGAVAALCLVDLVRRLAGDDAALRAVGVWACFPTAFVLHVPYAEACYAALASGVLLALITRRGVLAALLLTGAALSRGFVVPLSAAALVFLGRRWSMTRDLRWSTEVALLGVAAVTAPWIWMVVAAVVTGRLDAYSATQQAWGLSFTVASTVDGWRRALSTSGHDPYFTVVVLTLLLTAIHAVVAWRSHLPLEIKVYAVAATLFLLAISQPGAVAFGSIPRFAFGILTIPIVLALRVSNVMAVVFAVCGLALQFVWVLEIWSGRLGIAP